MRPARKQEVAKPVKSLRQACIERGIDPDNTGYKQPRALFNWVDRIIPGKADSESPSMWWARMRPGRSCNARKMYTRTSAANDAQQIAEGGIEAYVAAFERLNNLKGA